MIMDRLINKIKEKNNPTVVGLDPNLSFIPSFIKKESFEKYGETLMGAAHAFLTFNKMLIDEIYTLIPAVKPQVAMYEQYGAEGIDAYIKTIEYAKSKDLIVIGDIKRGDIASTAQAYSDGHIGKVCIGSSVHEVYKEDLITVNPYLGFDSIEPYISNCENFERGLFVLVKTSNPNSGQIQGIGREGDKVFEHVGRLVSKWGQYDIGCHGFSNIGAVVGCTYPNEAKTLRQLMPHTFFLVPGYGVQGGKAEDISGCFNKEGIGAIINSSRGIIAAYQTEQYKNKYTEKEFALAAKEAVVKMREDLTSGYLY